MAKKTKTKPVSRAFIKNREKKLIEQFKRECPDVINFCEGCPYYGSFSSWKENGIQHEGWCDYIEEVKSDLIEDWDGAKTTSVTLLSPDFDCPLTGLSPAEKKNIEIRKKVLEIGFKKYQEKQFKANKKKWKKKRVELVKRGKIKRYKVGDEEGDFRIKELFYIVNNEELYVLIDSEEEEEPSCWERREELISSIMEGEKFVQIKDITNELGYGKYKAPDIEKIEKIARLTHQALIEEYDEGEGYDPNTEEGTVGYIGNMSVEEIKIYESVEK